MTNQKGSFSFKIRTIHRYLGFFLSGIMAVYALSGIFMVFRNTDFLKTQVIEEQQLQPNLTAIQLPEVLKKRVSLEKKEGDIIYFRNGSYNQQTGLLTTQKQELPFLLEKMEDMHKATTNSPLYFLNIFFGVSLLFFVLSAFWMYTPKMSIFKKGFYFALGGFVLTVVILFV